MAEGLQGAGLPLFLNPKAEGRRVLLLCFSALCGIIYHE